MPRGRPLAVQAFLPFVDPGEAVSSPDGRLADRCGDSGRLQPVERGFQPVVVLDGIAPADEGEDFVRRRRH